MAAGLPETQIRIVLISYADGRTDGLPVGAYLASYNPRATEATASPPGPATRHRP